MALTNDDVRKIASLARLRFTPEEEAAYAAQLGQIVDYIDQLQQLPAGADLLAGPPAGAPEAADTVGPCLPRATFLANAPAVLDGFLLVPEVKGGAGDDELA
jgi:aspartyl-tRNA(Asn)/glutamyl-tRNA(Gln) amidotransferase subunit C